MVADERQLHLVARDYPAAVIDCRLGWYRFTAPPGPRRMRLDADCRGLQAWVNGRSVPVVDGSIVLDAPVRRASTVALRVEHAPGIYAGAAFHEPVACECDQGSIVLGDWSEHGPATYSGIGVYGTDVELNVDHLESRVTLDLGRSRRLPRSRSTTSQPGCGWGAPSASTSLRWSPRAPTDSK